MLNYKFKLSEQKLALILMPLLFLTACTSTSWKNKIDEELPILGHRNWIVIADSAYPKQSSSGIETIYTNASQIEVLDYVLSKVDTTPHVQAKVMLDQEMAFVPESDAPGIDNYKTQLDTLLQDKDIEVMPHEEIIALLDKDAKVFNILLLKSDMTIPYTSVFLKLDAGYWDANKEIKLRNKLKK